MRAENTLKCLKIQTAILFQQDNYSLLFLLTINILLNLIASQAVTNSLKLITALVICVVDEHRIALWHLTNFNFIFHTCALMNFKKCRVFIIFHLCCTVSRV